MSKKSDYAEEIFRLYKESGQPETESSAKLAKWAVDNGLWETKYIDQVRQCAEQLSIGLREVYHTDDKGRRVRSMHSARSKNSKGEQITLWADMRTATRSHMEVAFAQRRRQIVGDCVQLKQDADSYNESRPKEPPIQIPLDFELDVQELTTPVDHSTSMTSSSVH